MAEACATSALSPGLFVAHPQPVETEVVDLELRRHQLVQQRAEPRAQGDRVYRFLSLLCAVGLNTCPLKED
jgi:hypothetical protein